MNRQHWEYLHLMGIDLYVPRSPMSSAPEFPPPLVKTIVDDEEPETVESREEKVPDPVLDPKQIKPADPLPVPTENIELQDLAAVEPETDLAISKQSPLHFLWQQSGNLLLLSAETAVPSVPAVQLLNAICSALQRPYPTQAGSGNWPLIDAKPSSETEAQEFLRSFVQGRAERHGSNIVLVLFGETTQQLFAEVAGNFEDILGGKVSATGSIEEIRVVPALSAMLDKVYLKSLTWQSIKDLSGQ